MGRVVTGRFTVGLIGLGEVGQVLATDLDRQSGLELSAWDRLFPLKDSDPRRAALTRPYLRCAQSMSGAVHDRSLLISAVTADECLAAAAEAARALTPGTYYLDLHSVSPQRIASPVWLGGPHAADFLSRAHSLGFTGAAVYSSRLGAASAAKMCRSVIIKGMEALLAESLLTARRYGVEDAVLTSLGDLFPVGDWRKLARYMIGRSLQHGRRRAEEMREVVRTVAEAGFEPWMSRGCVERQEWAATHAAALSHEALADMLDAMLVRPPAAQRPAGEARG
jgi:3-hydroxyisobutyrate dehydrogenase-like beta-hydroxyacid dehydrogenase